MSQPREFMLTDVRCFEGEQRARLRPITLLVGENSTGKTTFLGCYSALHRLVDLDRFYDWKPDFNQEPFLMGSFRDIVRARRGPKGLIQSFEIGIKIDSKKENNIPLYWTKIIFSEDGSQPIISKVRYEFDDLTFVELNRESKKLAVKTIGGSIKLDDHVSSRAHVLFLLHSSLMDFSDQKNVPQDNELINILQHTPNFGYTLMLKLPNMIPIAPLRSKPKRTYDPVQETTSPEGDHVPMMMMRLSRTDDRHWRPMRENLSAFGRNSGMFSDIQVRRHGKQMSDPFQLQVKARSGTPDNIMDVGYGVSQSLPILVDIHSHRDSLFLLQQPEVHLHPRAQAELATVFVNSARKHGNSFMIETHSDHIVDRMRILVRQGKISAEDISILYFEPVKNAVQIHNIEVDGNGNLENAPPGYRDFFLRESDRLLGFED